jgi:hypothetical protein
MKFTKKYRQVVEEAFAAYNRLVQLEQDDYLERLCQVMSETKLKGAFSRGEADFRDFAIQAYLRNLKIKTAEWESILAAVKETRNIADFGFFDEEDEE